MSRHPVRWVRRQVDGVRSASDAPGRVKVLWAAEAVTAVVAVAAVGWGLAGLARAVDLDAWPPWLALAAAPAIGAAIAWGLLDDLLGAIATGHRWAVDRAERHGHVDVTDEDLPSDDGDGDGDGGGGDYEDS